MGKRKKRTHTLNALLVLLSLIFSFALCEFIVRITNRAPVLIRIQTGKENPYIKSTNPILGYELRAHAKFFGDLHPDSSVINSHGQWDIERSYIKPAGFRRIIILGDSVTVAADVLDIDKTITRQMEKQLSRNKIEVLNFGVTGYCTFAEVELLNERGLKYDPDVVIVNFVWNDYDNFNSDMGRISFDRPTLARFFFIHSALFRLVALKTNLYRFRNEAELTRSIPNKSLTSFDTDHIEELQKSRANSMVGKHLTAVGDDNVARGLHRLKELSRRHGFQVLLAVWPHFGANGIFDVEGFDRDRPMVVPPGSSLMIEKVAKTVEIPVVRLSRYFTGDYEKRRNQSSDFTVSPIEYYTIGDAMHPTAAGCRVAADILSSIIVKNLKLN